jgi:hypothetical protein
MWHKEEVKLVPEFWLLAKRTARVTARATNRLTTGIAV